MQAHHGKRIVHATQFQSQFTGLAGLGHELAWGDAQLGMASRQDARFADLPGPPPDGSRPCPPPGFRSANGRAMPEPAKKRYWAARRRRLAPEKSIFQGKFSVWPMQCFRFFTQPAQPSLPQLDDRLSL
jgi:hypothetical protein